MNHSFLYLAAFLLCTSGCIRLPRSRISRPATPLSDILHTEIARTRHAPMLASEHMKESHGRYSIDDITLSFSLSDGLHENTLRFEYYVPYRSDRAPVVIILPVSGGGYVLERYFARNLAEAGYAVLIAYRERGAKPTDGEEANRLLLESVLRNQRIIDWVETRPELDADRIGVLGTSMGAIKGALLLGTDTRIKAAVLGLGGSDVPYILAHSTEGAWRGGGITRDREAYMRRYRVTRAEFEQELRETIVWDPARLAPSVDSEKVLLILALCDTVVPFRKGLELRREMGRPETLIFPTGHYSVILYLPLVRRATLAFFRRHL